MGRLFRGWFALVVGLALLSGTPGALATPQPDVRLVVELDDRGKASGLDVVLDLPALDRVVVEVPADQVAATVASLRARGAGRVELDPRVEATRTTDDPLWSQQWGPQLVGVDDAWDRTAGAPSTTIAILDTGIDATHPDLEGAVAGGVDIENRDSDPDDDNGHGTDVAGIAAARGDNGSGIVGYCWRCSLLAVKVLDDEGTGQSSVVAAGIVWAVDHGADVVNLSLSSPSASFVLGDAVDYALSRDVVVVAAGGNDGLLQPTYPSAYPGVIGVVASDPTDRLYRWSNRGGWAAIAAPGCHRTTHDGGYADLCGTSAAAPAVAGVAGLMRSAAPKASATSVEDALRSSAVALDGTSTRRLDADAALGMVLSLEATAQAVDEIVEGAPSPPRGLRVQAQDGSATVTWMEPADTGASPITEYVVAMAPGDVERVVGADQRSVSVGGLVSGVTYRFSVSARNAIGASAPSMLSAPVTPAPNGVARVAGSGRILTSVALSQRAFARADAVVIARADEYADALAAAPLAAKLGGPLLLSDARTMAREVGAEIERLGATVVHLIGGQDALSPSLETALASYGVTNVVRTAGVDRFDTARRIAIQVGGSSVYVTNGVEGWPDAVAGSGLAAVQGRPILLVATDGVPASTRAALGELGAEAAVVIGGTGTVPAALLSILADPNGDGFEEISVSRIAGLDRYDTSRRIADVAVTAGADPSRLWLASGGSWPDALAAGPAIAARGGVLLLIRGDDFDSSPGAAAWLDEHAATLEEVLLVGGAASINDRAEQQVLRRLAGR